jgi:hypothetical protein
MADLATATRARIRVGDHAFDQLAPLTALQERERRATGRKSASPALVLRGSVRLVSS